MTLRGPPVGQVCWQWEIGARGQDIHTAASMPKFGFGGNPPRETSPIFITVHSSGVTLPPILCFFLLCVVLLFGHTDGFVL